MHERGGPGGAQRKTGETWRRAHERETQRQEEDAGKQSNGWRRTAEIRENKERMETDGEGRPWDRQRQRDRHRGPCDGGLGGAWSKTGSWSGRSCPAPGPPPGARPACLGYPAGTAGALLSSAPSHIRGCPRAGRTSAGPRSGPGSTHHHEGLGSSSSSGSALAASLECVVGVGDVGLFGGQHWKERPGYAGGRG